VEDDQKMKDGLRYIMRKEGYFVDAVNSGEAALKKINPTSCFFMSLGGKSYEYPIVTHVISIGYIRSIWV
jgi:hypothetical protein